MKNTIKIILLAAVSAALAIVAEQLVATTANVFLGKEIVLEAYSNFTWFLVSTAIIEELSKYWAVYFVIRKHFGIEKIKSVVASLFLGSCWGIFEVCLVLFSNQQMLAGLQTGNPNIVFSFTSIIVLHSLTALLMGIFISTNTFSGKLKGLKVLFFPVLIHILFNFLIIQKGNFTNYLVATSLAIFFVIGISILALNYRKLA